MIMSDKVMHLISVVTTKIDRYCYMKKSIIHLNEFIQEGETDTQVCLLAQDTYTFWSCLSTLEGGSY